MVSLERLRERIKTTVSNIEIERMAREVEAELARRYGPDGQTTVDLIGDPELDRDRRFLMLPRPADAGQTITVVETVAEEDTTLDSTDFRAVYRGRMLERLLGGPNGARGWAQKVRVTYTPIDETAARDEITIRVVQLELQHRGLDSESAGGDWRVDYPDVVRERERLLGSLRSHVVRMA